MRSIAASVAFASTTVSVVMLTIRRTVVDGVKSASTAAADGVKTVGSAAASAVTPVGAKLASVTLQQCRDAAEAVLATAAPADARAAASAVLD